MSTHTMLETLKKASPTVIPSRSLTSQRRSMSAPHVGDMLPSQGWITSGLGHHFSQVSIHPSTPPVAESCPLTTGPRACPFGGACHTCPARVQAKLAISQPGDVYEQQADRVAEQAMRMPAPPPTNERSALDARSSSTVQRKCAYCEEEGELLQKKESAGQASESAHSLQVPPIVHQVLRSPGQSLDAETRAFMEPHFGHDFSRVRIHTDAQAAESARMVNARAYAFAHHVVFGAGEYAPAVSQGRRLLAHELAHVVQQDLVTGEPSGISLPSEAAEHEAQSTAASVGSGREPRVEVEVGRTAPLMREIISANPSPSGGGGRPPNGLSDCKVVLGGRVIDHWLAGTLGFRHLYIDVYKGSSDYALIEGGPVGSTTTGTSGAWVKSMDWEARGIQWDITPRNDCPRFVDCLKRETVTYHGARHPYHYSRGPNSNSFAGWVLNQCGLSISPLISAWPYRGVDYWRTHTATAAASAPVTAPAPAGT